ncbi:hypothetical protein RGUI_0925 [Rhodovulum sp. P5]|uniref:hypothetical protein n=1 Tax=Rhodovulum sp. P5 TaxID=1564506 RepID=UPI0009C2E653|nr:hypothetical protein [Rhodovulum sp. P5]ARE39066.1 hypothetical protein RGUI_0925 [Rhodovulum sp. P5]
MTALKRFQRLESPGLWRESPDAQRRDVILSFGEASLVVSDMRERVLAHWSLAAIERINPGKMPALYRPGTDSGETLEIDESVMIDAIEAVRAALARSRPHPGRLRLWLLVGVVLAILGLGLFWLPGALVRHTVSVVPPEGRAEIGRDLLARVTRVAGPPCNRPDGVKALNRLTRRLLPDRDVRVLVLPGGVPRSAHLPGGLILLNRALVEDYETADTLAGFIIAEDARAAKTDPLAAMLSEVGLAASFKLLTSGHMPREALESYALTMLTMAPEPLPQDILLGRFQQARVPAAPYAYALDISGESVIGLIEADPMRGQTVAPLLSDGEWVQLQGICGG